MPRGKIRIICWAPPPKDPDRHAWEPTGVGGVMHMTGTIVSTNIRKPRVVGRVIIGETSAADWLEEEQ